MIDKSQDTQFAGFAELLWQEIRDTQRRQLDSLYDGLVHSSAEWDEEITKRISQRAYDLVKHVCETVDCEGNFGRLTSDAMIRIIPDVTTWPEVQE